MQSTQQSFASGKERVAQKEGPWGTCWRWAEKTWQKLYGGGPDLWDPSHATRTPRNNTTRPAEVQRWITMLIPDGMLGYKYFTMVAFGWVRLEYKFG